MNFLIGIGFSVEFYIGAVIIIITILLFLGLLIYKIISKKISTSKLLFLTFLFPASIVIISFLIYHIHDFVTSPMTVRKSDLKGKFVINRDLFRGKYADWQHDHYWINIEKDTLYLHIMNNGKEIKEYKRQIEYISPYYRGYSRRDHEFFEFSYSGLVNKSNNKEAFFKEETISKESREHHMLGIDPKLFVNPFSFNIILVSKKYGNMFFTKGEWEKR